MNGEVCDWCEQPADLQSVWDDHICDDCLQKMADEMAPDDHIPNVVRYDDCWRAVCPVCKNPGPGAETPAEARKLALLEEFVERDGTLACRLICQERVAIPPALQPW